MCDLCLQVAIVREVTLLGFVHCFFSVYLSLDNFKGEVFKLPDKDSYNTETFQPNVLQSLRFPNTLRLINNLIGFTLVM